MDAGNTTQNSVLSESHGCSGLGGSAVGTLEAPRFQATSGQCYTRIGSQFRPVSGAGFKPVVRCVP